MRPVVPPPVIDAAFLLAMVGAAGLMPSSPADIPGSWLLAGVLAMASVGVAVWGVVAFRRARTPISPYAIDRPVGLVTSGPYRFTRNPMYLGMAGIVAAFAIYLERPLFLAFLPLFMLVLTVLQIRPEEAAMARAFGPEYDAYRRRVPRWLFI